MKRASKLEMELRAGDAAKMLTEDHSGIATTSLMAENIPSSNFYFFFWPNC